MIGAAPDKRANASASQQQMLATARGKMAVPSTPAVPTKSAMETGYPDPGKVPSPMQQGDHIKAAAMATMKQQAAPQAQSANVAGMNPSIFKMSVAPSQNMTQAQPNIQQPASATPGSATATGQAAGYLGSTPRNQLADDFYKSQATAAMMQQAQQAAYDAQNMSFEDANKAVQQMPEWQALQPKPGDGQVTGGIKDQFQDNPNKSYDDAFRAAIDQADSSAPEEALKAQIAAKKLGMDQEAAMAMLRQKAAAGMMGVGSSGQTLLNLGGIDSANSIAKADYETSLWLENEQLRIASDMEKYKTLAQMAASQGQERMSEKYWQLAKDSQDFEQLMKALITTPGDIQGLLTESNMSKDDYAAFSAAMQQAAASGDYSKIIEVLRGLSMNNGAVKFNAVAGSESQGTTAPDGTITGVSATQSSSSSGASAPGGGSNTNYPDPPEGSGFTEAQWNSKSDKEKYVVWWQYYRRQAMENGTEIPPFNPPPDAG